MESNERWYHNITTIKTPKSSGIKVNKLVWHTTVDEATGMKISGFYQGKGNTIEPMREWLQKPGKPVKIVWQDNAGENKKLQKRCSSAD